MKSKIEQINVEEIYALVDAKSFEAVLNVLRKADKRISAKGC
jgi:hypothetical protein